MRLRPLAHLMLVCTLALAGCASPAVGPSPLGRAWRPALALPQTDEPGVQPRSTPLVPPAPGRTSALPSSSTEPSTPVSPASESGMQYSPADLITFQSDRRPSEGGYDIYVYDPGQDTVLAITGVNTPMDETHPRLADDGRWLVFQRGDGHGGADILLYNRQTRLLNTLPAVNSPRARETEPDITADGRLIVYVSDAGGRAHIRLYDVASGDAFELTGAGRQLSDVRSPTISGDGRRVAYSASTLNAPDSADIYLYDIPSASQLTPPFVNTLYREVDPELSPDGARLLFTSNRFGSDDVFECDLDTGFTDNFGDLNTAHDEQIPRYMGGGCDRILFQQRVHDPAYDQLSIRAFNRAQAMLDTLPVANMLLANSALGQ